MGTTMSFYWVRNTGAAPETLRQKLEPVRREAERGDEQFMKLLSSFMTPDALRQMREGAAAGQAEISRMFSSGGRAASGGPRLAYRQDAPWLPYFEARLCDGGIADSSRARRLSRKLGAPVLAFALFDSDICFVSYAGASGEAWDHAKPNLPEFEEFDREFFSTDFPDFILGLFPAADAASLRALWEGEEVFADGRMEKMCAALGLPLLYGEEAPPQGFEFL